MSPVWFDARLSLSVRIFSFICAAQTNRDVAITPTKNPRPILTDLFSLQCGFKNFSVAVDFFISSISSLTSGSWYFIFIGTFLLRRHIVISTIQSPLIFGISFASNKDSATHWKSLDVALATVKDTRGVGAPGGVSVAQSSPMVSSAVPRLVTEKLNVSLISPALGS
jgi:cadmium resistance protein CadD (predicted permease)